MDLDAHKQIFKIVAIVKEVYSSHENNFDTDELKVYHLSSHAWHN